MKNETLTQYIRRRLEDLVGHHVRIAAESGVPQTTVSRIYRGTSSPTAKTMEPLLAWFKAEDKKNLSKAKRAAKRAK